MSIDHLYILGNGFDIFHDIPSRYLDFGAYVQRTDPELYRIVEEYLGLEGQWNDFEAALAYLDTDTLIDEASNFLVSYGADDWSDSNHHDYQYEIKQTVEKLSVKLKDSFEVWMSSLPIPSNAQYSGSRLAVDPLKFFLTFNYTDTLQKTYGVPTSKTLHIHGSIISSGALVLGHAWERSERPSLNDVPNPEDMDTRVMEGNEIIDQYFDTTFKNSEDLIAQNKDFFSALNSVRKITVLGHSLAEVDMAYFYEIAKNIDLNTVSWEVTYYGDDELVHHKSVLSNLGVPNTLATFHEMSDLTQ